MANRTFQTNLNSLVKGLTKLFAVVDIGATGACTLRAWNPKTRAYADAPTATGSNRYQTGEEGIHSISRTSAGLYNLLLHDTYNRLLGVQYTIFNATGLPDPVTLGVLDSTDVATLATGINVQFSSATGSNAVDPANSDTIIFEFTLANSSAK